MYLLSRLPFWFLYRLSDIIFLVLYYLISYRKQIILANLRASFPTKSETEIRHIARQFYLNISDIIVETIKSYSISKKLLKQKVKLTNPEVLSVEVEAGQSVLVMASHLCNWEWQLLGSQAHFSFLMDGVYKPLSNAWIDGIMRHIRGRFGKKPIAMRLAIREIIQRKGSAYAYGLVADQTPLPNEHNCWVDFLNQQTPFFTGTARLAEMTSFPVLYLAMKRVKRGYYELTFHTLAKAPYTKGNNELILHYAKLLELSINEAPSDWLWSHKRWKHPSPAAQKV